VIARDRPPGTSVDKTDIGLGNDEACSYVEGSRQPAPMLCRFGTLGSKGAIYLVRVTNPGHLRVTAEAATTSPESNRNNNVATYDDDIERLESTGKLVTGPRRDRLAGRAAGRRLFYAVARLLGGAKLGEPRGLARTDSASASARRACLWLKSKRVRFRRERGRRCDEPSFLPARIRRGRWQIRLGRKLPPGRHVLLTRAEGQSGAIESGISAKRGNLERFRIR
jgi:hypothetical protein